MPYSRRSGWCKRMWIDRNYRNCVRLSLQIMQEQRRKLIKDSEEHYSIIYSGLHESCSASTRVLYFQAYEMEWLDNHWNALTEFLRQRKNDYTKREQKEITLFFAEHFSALMSEIENVSGMAKMALPELIRSNQKAIEQMIAISDNWEERSNQLKVNLKKHKEHFKGIIENAMNDNRSD